MEKMRIRPAIQADLERIEVIYAAARQFMCENGNPTQWRDGYPRRELLQEDIYLGRLYVAEAGNDLCGVFMFTLGEDPTYGYMVGGTWRADTPYGTIHRIASEITGGEIPVVFARGNHDMRGIYAENIAEHTPTDNGRSYYTFRLGSVWGMVLDCGEDKPDDHVEYAHTICCADFRMRQTEFMKNVILKAQKEYEANGVKQRLVIMHDPFTEYLQHQASETDMKTYQEWATLLREYIRPNLMICGHVHQAYITGVGGKLDNLGQPCPVVVGSAPGTRITLAPRGVWVENTYVGCGLQMEDGMCTVTFIGENGVTYMQNQLKGRGI